MSFKSSGPMWQRHLLSGSSTECTLLSFPFYWQKVGTEQLQPQSSTNKGSRQSIKAAPCQILLPVSQTPHHCWWVVPHLLGHTWVRWRNWEVAEPLRCQLLDQGRSTPRLTPLKMVLETHHHPPWTDGELIQMGIPRQVKHLVVITAEREAK